MNGERFLELLDKMSQVKIAVLGDLFLDRIFYICRQWDEISVETGLTAYQIKRKKCVPGAAGVVTSNLKALGVGQVYGLGILSGDGEGFELEKGLKETGVDTSYMVRTDEFFTPTYTKTFFEDEAAGQMDETHRLDLKNRKHLTKELEEEIIQYIRILENKVDAFVCLEQLEDGECGIFTDSVRKELSRVGKQGTAKVFVDSRFHIRMFDNAIIKCNDLEALRSLEWAAPENESYLSQIDRAVKKLSENRKQPVIVSCGETGMKVWDGKAVKTVPAFLTEGEVDICGAGDSALAGIAAAVCAGADLEEAALLGNIVASLIVQQIGVTGVVDLQQLKQRFYEYKERWKEL